MGDLFVVACVFATSWPVGLQSYVTRETSKGVPLHHKFPGKSRTSHEKTTSESRHTRKLQAGQVSVTKFQGCRWLRRTGTRTGQSFPTACVSHAYRQTSDEFCKSSADPKCDYWPAQATAFIITSQLTSATSNSTSGGRAGGGAGGGAIGSTRGCGRATGGAGADSGGESRRWDTL